MKRLVTVIWKDITRFLPLWGSWLVLLTVIYFWRPYDAYYSMTYPVCIYAGICAVALFGDLYDIRRCNTLQAMPLRREGWFLAHSLAGLLCFLMPTCVFYGIVALIRGNADYWLITLGFLGSASLEFICFFGIALLSVILAGNRIGAAMIYCVANLIAPVLRWLLTTLYQPFLMGIPMDTGFFDYLSPVVVMAQQVPGYYPVHGCTPPFSVSYIWNGDWNYFLICAGIGILAALLAGLLYRFRKPERAGSFCVCRGMQYVFTAAFSLVAGTLMFQLLEHKSEQYFFLFLYVPFFYIVAAMLAEKQLYVFRAGHLLTLGILATVLFNSLWIIRYDALGINTYVPKPENVRSVTVLVDTSKYSDTVRYDDSDGNWDTGLTVTAVEDITSVTDAHRELLAEDRAEKKSMVYLTYTLKSGIKIRRYYPLARSTYRQQLESLDSALSSQSALFGAGEWGTYMKQVYYIRVSDPWGSLQMHFGEPDRMPDALPSDVKVQQKALIRELMIALGDDGGDGKLKQMARAEYIVCIKSRDSQGEEKIVEFTVPEDAEYVVNHIERCRKIGLRCPDRTVTEDTDLTDYR